MTTMRNYRIEASFVWQGTAESPKPDLSFMPPMERRRLTGVERAALAAAWQVRSEGEIPVVFASRWGEIGVTAKLMRQFHEEGEMSPAGFSASVHNAAPGAFSLLTKNHAPYTAVAARERSLECGLLEALAMGTPVVFVYAEESTPELYRGEFDYDENLQSYAAAVRISPAVESAAAAGEGTVQVEFRVGDAMEPLSFADFVGFLAGSRNSLATASYTLTRG